MRHVRLGSVQVALVDDGAVVHHEQCVGLGGLQQGQQGGLAADRKCDPQAVQVTGAACTVALAKTTALPAVPTSCAADSSTSMPRVSWERCRVAMHIA